MKKKICCVIGTRPEIIKMAPIIHELQQKAWAEVIVLNTAQHRELADPIFKSFNIVPDVDLNMMRTNQSLAELTGHLMIGLGKALLAIKPDMVIGQGDTTTVFTAALTSFYHHIPFAHVEAGLRTHSFRHPFPEEMNRVLAARLASLHFAPTAKAKEHLLKENIPEANIHITGNTVVDAVLSLAEEKICLPFNINPGKRLILVTVHRRESLGDPLQNICQAILSIVNDNPDVELVFPMHANPDVQKTVIAYLGQHPQIRICLPLLYHHFISLVKASYLVLTDSGGVQEEASILGVPLLILRETTERDEVVMAGVARLVGTKMANIIEVVKELLNNPATYKQMAKCTTLYGDGSAAKRMVTIVENYVKTPNCF